MSQRKRAGSLLPVRDCAGCRELRDRDVRGLQAFRATHDLELDCGALGEGAETATLDGREMDEHVVTILARDEAEALGVVEPLHITLCSHRCISFPCCLRRSESWFCSRAGKSLVTGPNLGRGRVIPADGGRGSACRSYRPRSVFLHTVAAPFLDQSTIRITIDPMRPIRSILV